MGNCLLSCCCTWSCFTASRTISSCSYLGTVSQYLFLSNVWFLANFIFPTVRKRHTDFLLWAFGNWLYWNNTDFLASEALWYHWLNAGCTVTHDSTHRPFHKCFYNDSEFVIVLPWWPLMQALHRLWRKMLKILFYDFKFTIQNFIASTYISTYSHIFSWNTYLGHN